MKYYSIMTILQTGHIDIIQVPHNFIEDIIYNDTYHNTAIGPITSPSNDTDYFIFFNLENLLAGQNDTLTELIQDYYENIYAVGQAYIIKFYEGHIQNIDQKEYINTIKIIDTLFSYDIDEFDDLMWYNDKQLDIKKEIQIEIYKSIKKEKSCTKELIELCKKTLKDLLPL